MDATAETGVVGFRVVEARKPGRALLAARAVPEGISIQCTPRWRNAEAVLTADALILRHGRASVLLSWDDDWSFVPFAVLRFRSYEAYGVGVAHPGAAKALWWSWAVPLQLVPLPGRHRRVAIDSAIPFIIRRDEDIAMLEALRQLFAADPSTALRLDRPERVAALATSMRTWTAPWNRLRPRVQSGRVQEIQAAMARLGYVHASGRPMPGWIVDEEEVIADVTAEVLSIPELREARIPQEQIDAVIHGHYLSVVPWPFEALFDA